MIYQKKNNCGCGVQEISRVSNGQQPHVYHSGFRFVNLLQTNLIKSLIFRPIPEKCNKYTILCFLKTYLTLLLNHLMLDDA